MSQREVHLLSYFSLPTDLATEMRGWPEFVSGNGYSVDLSTQLESVAVKLVEGESPYISVVGKGSGLLFERVLGVVTYALAGHSDNIVFSRVS